MDQKSDNKDIILINKKEILQFNIEGGKIALKKNAEEELIKLLDIFDFIQNAVEDVKKKITESGKKAIGNDFKGIFGERVKAIYRYYGDKYKTSNPEFIKEIVIKRSDGKKIDEYIEAHGELPDATSENEREGKLVIQRIDEEVKQLGT